VTEQTITNDELRRIAATVTAKAQQTFGSRPGQHLMGYVGAALVTESGALHTGVVLNLQVGIGFCAESSAVAEMVKHGESRVARICASTVDGAPLPPCGRCRELLYQIDPANLDTEVLMPTGSVTLRSLLPDPWQPFWDQPVT
jgi:cytidine deaminase